jgi:hypothetical protein
MPPDNHMTRPGPDHPAYQVEPETTTVDMPLSHAEALEVVANSAARSEWAWEIQHTYMRGNLGGAWAMESAEATDKGVRITCRRVK